MKMRTNPLFSTAILLTLGSLGLFASMPAAAEGAKLSTAERIHEAANEFMAGFTEQQQAQGRQVEYELGSLDQRLSLSQCTQPLDVEFSGDPMRSTRTTLLVSCQAERPWRMFLKADLEIRADGWVAERPIGRGQRLEESMLEQTEVVINQRRRSGYRNPEHMIGMKARRSINAGTAITPDMLVAPEAVERGDRVIISAGNDVFSIQTRGEAVRGGRIGEQITVINENSGRRVQGRIVEQGRVDINQ